MKKILLTAGTLTSIAAPVAMVISCGGDDKPDPVTPGPDNKDQQDQQKKQQHIEDIKDQLNNAKWSLDHGRIDNDVKETLPSLFAATKENVLENLFKITSGNDFDGVAINDFSLTPDDNSGTLTVIFSLNKEEQKVSFSRVISGFQNPTTHQEAVDREFILKDTKFYDWPNHPEKSYWTLHLTTTLSNMTGSDWQSVYFASADWFVGDQNISPIITKEPYTGPNVPWAHSTQGKTLDDVYKIAGIDPATDPKLQGMEIISLQFGTILLGHDTDPWGVHHDDGSLRLNAVIKHGTVTQKVVLTIYGFKP